MSDCDLREKKTLKKLVDRLPEVETSKKKVGSQSRREEEGHTCDCFCLGLTDGGGRVDEVFILAGGGGGGGVTH